ncbi:MAG: YkvA family protein [Woeseiaceae bacterium]
MPLDITFTLSDADLDHFQAIVDKAKSAMESEDNVTNIETAARQLIADAKSTELPGFIADRLSKLEVVIDMTGDEEWQLSEEERRRVLGALVYFCDPEDLIPDHIPGLGFLDDAIYVELVIRELKAEIDSYEEFVAFRSAEEKRRADDGLDTKVGREEWLADKRAALHAKMRKRRRASTSSGGGGGWHLRW